MSVKSRIRPLLVQYRYRGIRAEDVMLASYPRSGSTWLRFMLYEIITGTPSDFDVVNRAIPYVGGQRTAEPLMPDGGRLIKTHELRRARTWRSIYLVRDARAILPSMYQQRKRGGYPGDFPRFVQEFVSGDVCPFGSWDQHVNFWTAQDTSIESGLLVVRFEDMRADPADSLRSILSFVGIEVNGPALLSAIHGNDLGAMRKKELHASARAIVNRREDLPFIGTGSKEPWRELDPTHIAAVEASAGDALERFGYPLVGRPGR